VGAERGGLWGVDGRVEVPRHALSIVGAEGFLAEGGVCVLMFEGLRWSALLLFLISVVLLSVGGGVRGNQGIVVQVPVQSGGVEGIEAASVVG